MFLWRGEDSVVWQRQENFQERGRGRGPCFPCSLFSCLMDWCIKCEKLAEKSTWGLAWRPGGILPAR